MINNTYDLKKEKIKISLIYATFGTIGIVTHFIPLSSPSIVFYRAVLGALFIIASTYIRGHCVDFESIITNFLDISVFGRIISLIIGEAPDNNLIALSAFFIS